MNSNTSKRSPLFFFILVYSLSIPLWVLNVIYPMKLPVDNLPVTDTVATFSPMVAASILVYQEEKLLGVRNLLKRTFDYKRITKKVWYAPIIFLMPFIYVLTYMIMRLVGLPVPTVWNPPLLTPLLFIAFFLAAAGEELGYSGYVTRSYASPVHRTDSQSHHWVDPCCMAFPVDAFNGHDSGIVYMGRIYTGRKFPVLTVWLYNNTGKSVFAAILFHAVTNTGRSMFPGSRSAFQLYDGAIGYGLIAITAVIVVFLWGSKTLTRFRYA